MNDNAAHNDNNSGDVDSVTVMARCYSDGRMGFRGETGRGEEVSREACAKIMIATAMAFDANAGLHNALESFAKCIALEYGNDKAREYLLAMIAAHNSTSARLQPTANDILQGD